MNEKIEVCQISSKEAEPWILNRHYAKRLCPISFAFGAFIDTEMVGAVTFGTPLSSTLRNGLCGEFWADHVLELNRLCCKNEKNFASILVSRSLRLLPVPKIVVSYADIVQGHVGYVYQATNFFYTGLSAKVMEWTVRGMEHLHHATIHDESRGQEDRLGFLKKKYGDSFYQRERSRKHRYVYFCGNKRQKIEMFKALKYKVEPYPKGDTKRYDASAEINTQMRLL
jgi:hypothetical protein